MPMLSIPDAQGGAPHEVSVHDASAEQFAARLRKVAKERRKWAKRTGVASYRIYDADLPDYAVAIDWYASESGEPHLHIAEYQAPKSIDEAKAANRFADVLAIAPVALGVPAEHTFAKVRQQAKGGSQYAQAVDEKREPCAFVTTEPSCGESVGACSDTYRFEVDMNAYLDTGLFLDHRVTRQLVGRVAADMAARAAADGTPGPRFLNLFAYTGSATVHAAGSGTVLTTTVDLSQTYLDWAARNMALNGFTGKQHHYERGDTLAWLEKAARRGEQWELIFVDPPTFSNSKAMGERTWDVQRDHVALLKACWRVLAPGGTIIFSNNRRSFTLDDDELARLGIELRDITAETIPDDFARNPKIHCCFIAAKQ